MRNLPIIVLAVCFAAPAFCEEDRTSEEVKRIIQKALDAHGGEDKLKRLTSFFVETTESRTDKEIASTRKRYVQLPNHCRSETEFKPDSRLKSCVIVQTRDRHWIKQDDQPTRDVGKPSQTLKDSIRFAGPRIILQIVDPESTVTLIGNAKVGEKDVVGVNVKSTSETKYFFDSQSGLLVKREYSRGETIYSNYQKVDGIAVARKSTHKRAGKVFLTRKVVEFKVVNKHDPALFEKPQ